VDPAWVQRGSGADPVPIRRGTAETGTPEAARVVELTANWQVVRDRYAATAQCERETMTAGAICAPGGRTFRSRLVRRDAVSVSRVETVGASAVSTWEPPSWDEVVREHSARVYRLAYRLTGNQHDAEDLTQDVFIRVFRSLDGYTPGTFEGWLHRITTNLFLDRMRRAARIRFEALPEDAERLPGRDAGPEAAVLADLFDPDIERALAALPPDFRAAVVLCDVEQLSYEEIAATLGIKLGTVRSRISRGRAMLRAALVDRAPIRLPDDVPEAGERPALTGEIPAQTPATMPAVVR
jgi:RNA polymerase sigma factor (sigma-70 family)